MTRFAAWAGAFLLSGLIWLAVFWAFWPAAQSSWRDRPPSRFQGDTSAIVNFTTEGEIQRRCPMPRGFVAVGCTVGPTINVPNPCRWHDPYAVLLCHEIGHTQGWSALHER